MKTILSQLKHLFYFDVRSLALTRMALATIVLADLLIRITDLEANYTDFGLLPRAALLQLGWEEWFISVHLLSGNFYIQLFMFIIAAFSAFSLLIGYRTTLSTALTWFLLISLHNRNPVILQGGDVFLRCLLFWGIFIPWGKTLSVDSFRLKIKKVSGNKVFSIGAFAFITQISLMYVSTALLKTGPEWVKDYSAIYYTLSLDQFRLLLGNMIYQFPMLMKILTFLTYWVELLGTILFFIPFKTDFFRFVGFITFALFQTGLVLSMRLGLFPFIAIAALFILLPTGFWIRSGRLHDLLNSSFRYLNESLTKTGIDHSGTVINFQNKHGDSRLRILTVVFFLLFVVYWNISTATGIIDLNRNTVWLGHLLRLDQKWDMFSPGPFTDDGWYVIPGKLRDGSNVDVYRNRDGVIWSKADNAISDYKNYRWRKYMRRLWLRNYSDYRLYYGKYLCRKWNREHDYKKQLIAFDIYFMKEDTLPDYKTEEVEKIRIWQHRCF